MLLDAGFDIDLCKFCTLRWDHIPRIRRILAAEGVSATLPPNGNADDGGSLTNNKTVEAHKRYSFKFSTTNSWPPKLVPRPQQAQQRYQPLLTQGSRGRKSSCCRAVA
eukprot:GILI01042689.1.p1 GENE.GILI01042689.1~~GILI01042689.1.p1  ORF type:complete len:108 (-),score=2.37 GILI01042689.1:7-330(-)